MTFFDATGGTNGPPKTMSSDLCLQGKRRPDSALTGACRVAEKL
jgi:hypothetical protein